MGTPRSGCKRAAGRALSWGHVLSWGRILFWGPPLCPGPSPRGLSCAPQSAMGTTSASWARPDGTRGPCPHVVRVSVGRGCPWGAGVRGTQVSAGRGCPWGAGICGVRVSSWEVIADAEPALPASGPECGGWPVWSPPAPSASSLVSLRTAKLRSEHHQIRSAREHSERREAESCPRVPGQALRSGPELARGHQLLISLSAQLPAPAVRQTFMGGPAGAGPAGASVCPSAFVQGGAISPNGWPQVPSVPAWLPAVFSPLTRLLTPEPNSWAV